MPNRINSLPRLIAELDFSRMRQKLLDPKEGIGLTVAELDQAESEYRRFLALHHFYPHEPLVPSRLVDQIWHAHILDTQRYSEDCIRLFGHMLHHDPYMGIDGDASARELDALFERTRATYERHFGPYPYQKMSLVRCEGHACHVPSACACRVPGACKKVFLEQSHAILHG